MGDAAAAASAGGGGPPPVRACVVRVLFGLSHIVHHTPILAIGAGGAICGNT